MKTTPQADPESVNHQLAEFLLERREEIIRAWVERVEADPAIHSESLSRRQLRDHLPQLFDDMAEALRAYGSQPSRDRFSRDADKHGVQRWEQGYQMPELLREVMHLRAVFIYHLRVFEESHAEFGSAAQLFAHSTVHGFLDELGIDGAEQFLRLEKSALASGIGRIHDPS